MKVGCVKEIKKQEYRVGMTPDNVKSYVNAGHTVYIEAGAGEGSGFEDSEYSAAGALLCADPGEVWEKSDRSSKSKNLSRKNMDISGKGLFCTHISISRQTRSSRTRSLTRE